MKSWAGLFTPVQRVHARAGVGAAAAAGDEDSTPVELWPIWRPGSIEEEGEAPALDELHEIVAVPTRMPKIQKDVIRSKNLARALFITTFMLVMFQTSGMWIIGPGACVIAKGSFDTSTQAKHLPTCIEGR